MNWMDPALVDAIWARMLSFRFLASYCEDVNTWRQICGQLVQVNRSLHGTLRDAFVNILMVHFHFYFALPHYHPVHVMIGAYHLSLRMKLYDIMLALQTRYGPRVCIAGSYPMIMRAMQDNMVDVSHHTCDPYFKCIHIVICDSYSDGQLARIQDDVQVLFPRAFFADDSDIQGGMGRIVSDSILNVFEDYCEQNGVGGMYRNRMKETVDAYEPHEINAHHPLIKVKKRRALIIRRLGRAGISITVSFWDSKIPATPLWVAGQMTFVHEMIAMQADATSRGHWTFYESPCVPCYLRKFPECGPIRVNSGMLDFETEAKKALRELFVCVDQHI